MRRIPRTLAALASVAALALPAAAEEPARALGLADATVADLRAALDDGTLTSERLVRLQLARIAAYDRAGPEIRAFLHVAPDALERAKALDAERRAKGRRSPLHGLTFVVKGMFDVEGLPTTGGLLPKAGVVPTKDALVVRRLKDAGAIVLGKVNASSFGAVATKNPYDLARMPGFSSSGTAAAVSAWFSTVGLGSETGFSIRTPSSDANLCGLSSTPGLISRGGVVCGWLTGERPGPMARSVADLAATLDAIAGFDPEDLSTAASLGKMPERSYASFVSADGLKGARVGVLVEPFRYVPCEPEVLALCDAALKVFDARGATVLHGLSLGVDLQKTLRNESFPSRFERAAGLDLYFGRQGAGYPFRRASDLLGHPDVEVKPEAAALLRSPPDLDRDPEYRGLVENREALRRSVIELMDRFRVDVLVYPHKLFPPLLLGPKDEGPWANQLSSLGGLPALIVPMGFSSAGHPYGLEVLGRPWSEPTLIRVASGFEAATRHRKAPKTTPALEGERLRETPPPR